MFPPFFSANGGPGAPTSEELRMSLEAYNREMAKLQNCPPGQLSQNMSSLLGLHTQGSTNNNNNNNNSSSNNNNNNNSGANSLSNCNTNNIVSGNASVGGGSGHTNGSQPPVSNGIIQDLSLPKAERKPDAPKLPNGDLSNDKSDFKKDSCTSVPESFSEAMKHAGSAFSLVRPKTETSKNVHKD
jgi:homeobox protein cut-like